MHQVVIISNRVTAMRHGIKKINFKYNSHTYYVTHAIYMLQIKIKFRLKFLTYDTHHKSLKQTPFLVNFYKLSCIHSSYFCSHSNVPLSLPNVEPPIFWSTDTMVTPKSTSGKGKRTQVFQDF